ncbi:MAG: hypothetical protein ACKOPN_01050 [Prochlorococcaceae cyanobacterium]
MTAPGPGRELARAAALLLGLLAARPAAAQPLPRPPGWASDTTFLGRWQAHSTAGAAVLDVLSVRPERVRWGTPFNGFCSSAYSVQRLADGRGRPGYSTVRLTLEPRPCRSGDAVLELAVALDGSRRAEVSTYAADGRLIGWYGELTPILGR